MKKQNLLKLAMMMLAMLFVTSAWAQTDETNGGAGVPGSATVTFAADASIYMVEGTTIPLYAEPDPVYHSSWTYGSNWTLTDGFTWNWSRTGGANDTGSGTETFLPAASNLGDNYVTISIDTDGQYEIQVTETASAAYGSCPGAPTTLIINVVNTPAATLGALAGASVSYCPADAAIPASIPVTISEGWQNYRLVWTLEIATLSGAPLAKDEWFDTDLTTSLGGALVYAEEYTTAFPEEVPAAGPHDIMSHGGFAVIGGKPTVYTYTLTSINDQALRFGDYIDLAGVDTDNSAFTYNAIGETYTIQINPAPTTGPIYHIPATWAN